ncbi:MAG TPA: PAS domain S-box protein, partial [Stellaceae bacterium]|nr:PAS domain S-box protein [Stellaceae bacterium]
ATRGLHVPAMAPPPRVPRWVAGVGFLTLVLAVAAVLCVALLFAQSLSNSVAAPAAIVLATLALGCGVAAIVGRHVHGAVIGKLDLLNQALATAANAHLIAGAEGQIVYANAAFGRFFPGLVGPPLDALQRRLVAGEGSVGDLASLRRDLDRQGRASGRIAISHPAGPVAWFSVSAHRLAGKEAASLWNFEDVTERQAMEQEIRDERAMLADFLDHAPSGLYSVDGAGNFLFVNAAFAEWLGVTVAELIGQGAKLSDFLADPPPAGAPPHAPFAGAAHPDQQGRGEVMLKTHHGRTIHALITQSVVKSGTGLRTHSMVRDLAPERDWQQALTQSRERFERFFANAPVGIGLLDREGKFVEANATLGAFLGAEPSALIGKVLTGYLVDSEQSEVGEKLATALRGGLVPGPIALRLPGGKSASLVLTRDSEDGLILHFIDTTDQKKIEAQFTQSQKMQAVGQLAGGVAHDFNNLLTAMIGFCDLLLQQHGPGDRSFPDIMQIKQNANRAANLVRQLLAFSRQQTLQPRVLNITDALADLSHLIRRLIGENIALNVVHGRDLGLIKVDQGQLEQVIINLAVNARDAMNGGGTLTIQTDNVELSAPIRRGDELMPVGKYVVIGVGDTGCGIPKENLERIFEPFFSTKEVGAGTGLGLSTVYGIVKQTGGFVLVDSEVGKGSTFSIYLPRHEGEEEGAGTSIARADEASMPKDLTGAGTVLLVEDEDPVRLFSSRALKNKGYTVIEAESAEQALEKLAESVGKIDLVITDVVMPKMDGPTLIKQVRELYPDRALKVIFMSGYTEDNFRQRLGDDVDIHFLPKPFSLKQLAGKVKEVMAEGD